MKGHRCPSHRRAFSMTEVLIASGLFIGIIGISLVLWLQTTADTFRGEDALNTVQDAGIIIQRLRNDLLRISPAPSEPYFVRWAETDGSTGRMARISLEPSTGIIERDPSPAFDDIESAYEQSHRQLVFFMTDDTDLRRVSYTFHVDRSSVVRQVQGQGATTYALPRLQDFRVSAFGQTPEGTVWELTGDDGPASLRIRRLWFRVLFSVRSDADDPRTSSVSVSIESRVFPRFVNRQLLRRWSVKP